MAGAGYKLFNTGDVLTAAQVNTYLNEQTVMVFASSTARTTALSGVLAEGMVSYLQDTNAVEVYNGSAWVGVSGAGDITEVQAGVGISIASGTGPIPIITNSSTDLITTAGDLLYGTAADTVARLGIGTAGQVLTVNSGATAPQWAAPAAALTFVGASARSDAAQSLANVTETVLNWELEDYDTNSFHDNVTNNSRLTIPSGKSGYYQINIFFAWANNATGNREVILNKNGTIVYYTSPAAAAGQAFAQATFIVSATAGDYFTVSAYQSSGGALNAKSTVSQANRFQIAYLGA